MTEGGVSAIDLIHDDLSLLFFEARVHDVVGIQHLKPLLRRTKPTRVGGRNRGSVWRASASGDCNAGGKTNEANSHQGSSPGRSIKF